MRRALEETFFPVADYDLDATLNSGQVFRWTPDGAGWVGVVARRWVRLEACAGGIIAQAVRTGNGWGWLARYLQVEVSLRSVLATFPADGPMQAAVNACRGLRLLRQDPWECLASFILSSNNHVRRIREMIATLCERYGEPVEVPPGYPPAFAFPEPERIAAATERELRRCKLGFRAPYLLGAARAVARREPDLTSLGSRSYETARRALLELPGVGPKVADCVLLFAYGFQTAFPVDVWILRALRMFYFRGRKPTRRQIDEFVRAHFGPYAGYAQQYLYHYMRTRAGTRESSCADHPSADRARADVPTRSNHLKASHSA